MHQGACGWRGFLSACAANQQTTFGQKPILTVRASRTAESLRPPTLNQILDTIRLVGELHSECFDCLWIRNFLGFHNDRSMLQDVVGLKCQSTYPRIARKAAREKAEIQWGDEMGVRSDDQIGRTWGKIGETPVIKVSGQRFSCQMISLFT